MSDNLKDMYPGFASHRFNTSGAEIFLRTGGSGPPLLLLHGYPQTHVCWHRLAPVLAKHFTLVIPDLRGYGNSSKPASKLKPTDSADHHLYSKRTMALDCVEVMQQLEHRHFMVAGHDRGARVAYRMALDHPHAITALAVFDIVTTWDAWMSLTQNAAMNKFHWTFLAQPAPFPEQMIAASADHWHERLLDSWSAAEGLSAFDPDALAHYRQSYRGRECIHAMCEDYRAGQTVDFVLDQQDRDAGNKIVCPTLALWGEKRSVGTVSNTLECWCQWCSKLEGQSIDSGHFLAEENPNDLLAHLIPFLQSI